MHGVLRSVIAVVVSLAVLAIGGHVTALACSIAANGCGNTSYSCNAPAPQAGAYQQMSGPAWPQWVSATVTSYNPSPVWTVSDAWTALVNTKDPTDCHNGNQTCFAQVGWVHWSTCSDLPVGSRLGTGSTCSTDGNEHVFTEWTSNSGAPQPVFYYNIPSGNEDFEVTRDSSQNFHFVWDEGSEAAPTTVNWGPDTIQNIEETHDVSPNNNDGSQAGGGANSKVYFSSMFWEDQNNVVYTPSQTYGSANNYYIVVSPSSGISSSLSFYDGRC